MQPAVVLKVCQRKVVLASELSQMLLLQPQVEEQMCRLSSREEVGRVEGQQLA